MCQTPLAKKMKKRSNRLGKTYYLWLRNYIVKTEEKNTIGVYWRPFVVLSLGG